MSTQIPGLDFHEYQIDISSFAQKLGVAFQTFGFVEIFNHPIPQSLIDETLATIADVFSCQKKRKINITFMAREEREDILLLELKKRKIAKR